jgi:6-phosphogluconate dehydrogenase
MPKQQFGVIGLGVMGENLALNVESRGFSVAGFDLDAKKVDAFAAKSQGKSQERKATAAHSLAEFLAQLEIPRRILIMVPAGKAVDAALADLRPRLAPGDLVIDGGNTLFSDTARRMKELEGTGILYMGVGISGGEEGALHGPSIMPGGDPAGWPLARPILQAIAAKADDGTPCCDWVGPGGAGHFVKMVHNGIEYADMQIICEAYWLLEKVVGFSPEESSCVFASWNQGELSSYLVSITADILAKKDPQTGKALVDVILDTAEQKGTGKWTGQIALDLGVAAPTVADAVFARTLSALKQERVAAAKVLSGPVPAFSGDRAAFVESIRKALLCSKICAYAQGFQLLRSADHEYQWNLRLGAISSLWRAGCIIRAQFLGKIEEAYSRKPELANLLLAPPFAAVLGSYQQDWRQVVSVAALQGVPAPAFMSALAYYDGYRSANLPANLLQAQRDFFGAHTYRRIDKEGTFHTQWNA